jgi:hypothetical protein
MKCEDNRGEGNGNAKFTNEMIKAIRWSKGKITERELAEIYGVHFSTINRILNYKTWRHL